MGARTNQIKRVFRLALIGLVAIIILFLAGFLTNHIARYSPMKAALTEELTQAQDELSQAKQSIANLQGQVDDLSAQIAAANDRIATMEQDKENLQADLDSANLHIGLLRTVVELKTAHIELKNDNVVEARAALSDTAARLETLKPLVETVEADLVENMLTRLTLILGRMDVDSATAQADLGLLAENLQSVETLLFGNE
jgi:chromosome segregation ATPase